MDDEVKDLLRSIHAGQLEQTELLRRHLLRLRFSLWSLLMLTTLVGVVLGGIVIAYKPSAPAIPTATPTTATPTLFINPVPPPINAFQGTFDALEVNLPTPDEEMKD